MNVFEARVQAALDQSPIDAQRSITGAVTDQIQMADPTLRVEATGYFNHSYIPDLIGTWSTPAGTVARPYYLRFQLDAARVREDVAKLGGDSPAIIGLLPSEPEQQVERRQLLDQSPTTLVAEGSAIEDLAARVRNDEFAALIPRAVMRAGRGYLDEQGAAELAVAADEGFDAAANADEEATRSALTTIHRHIADAQAVELERTLGVLWMGSGGDRDAFPAGLDLDSSPLPGTLRETLRILFSRPAIEGEGFWARIAGWIGVEDLLSFGELEPSPNLQLLMAEASSRLKFVSVALGTSELSPGSSAIWSVANGGLLFQDPAVTLHFVTDGRTHSHWPEQYDPPTWEALKPRLTGLVVERAEFDSGSVSVRVDAKREAGPEQQEEVLASIQGMSGLGKVREIVVRAVDNSAIRCRMACRVATAGRSRRVAATEIGAVALAVVANLEASEVERVGGRLRGEHPSPVSPPEG